MSKNEPVLKNVQYCIRCCMPETQEGIKFDAMGICQACQSSEQKIHIDWVEREKQLRKIFDDAKARSGDGYDCILGLSGGKDSMFQAYVLTRVYGLKVLGVTANHNWYSETGWYNLQNLLDQFDIDHIMFTPHRKLVNKLAKRSIEMIGDTCWHCHAGAASFPYKVAVRFKIPLIIWGESVAEASGRATYKDPVHKFDREYALKVSSKIQPDAMVCDYITKKDVFPYQLISKEEYDKFPVEGLCLGDYIFWDDERQMEFVRDNFGWKETEIEGSYKGFKSAECIMPGMHDFTCYLKRGYGRGTYQACVDVRNGLLTRDEGFELARKIDTERPEALDYYLKITGMTEEEFYKTMQSVMVDKIKGVKLPVTPKERPNREVIKPFVEQLVDRIKDRKDPREDK